MIWASRPPLALQLLRGALSQAIRVAVLEAFPFPFPRTLKGSAVGKGSGESARQHDRVGACRGPAAAVASPVTPLGLCPRPRGFRGMASGSAVSC